MTEVDYREIGQRAVDRARTWIRESTKYPEDPAARLLAKTLKDPKGLDFTVGFVDGVIRPEDPQVAAHNLAQLAKNPPRFLPSYLKAPVRLGGITGEALPEVVIPTARKAFQKIVGDLVVPVSEAKLGPAIERLRANGANLNMNLLGEAVLGDKEARRRLDETMKLLKRDDVDYVSLKVSAVTGPHNPWAYDEVVERAVEWLLPLYLEANSYDPRKFVNLDMEEYHDLHLTIDVFKRILDRPELKQLSAGIVLQTYLPDALGAMKDLQEWAAKRVADGGAPIKVRVVKGANLSMETVDAQMHGWELTTQPSKQFTDANYLRVLNYALTAEHTKNVRIGVAGMNLFTVAYAYELAKERGILETGGVEFEMLSGMAEPQSRAVSEDTGPLLFYVPVVDPKEYDVAIAYLVRRLEENSAPQNFMSSVFDLATDEAALEKEQRRFNLALTLVDKAPQGPNRKQNRLTETEADVTKHLRDPKSGTWKFANTPDSDPALPANLEWARQIVKRMKNTQLGVKEVKAARVEDSQTLTTIIEKTAAAGRDWGQRPAAERAEILHRVGIELAKRRGKLMEIAGAECGKTLDQSDVEVSEAIDFAHYYAQQALELEKVEGATFTPDPLIVVTPPWNFPIAIPTGGCMAALAAGSGVIFKPAGPARRVGAIVAEAVWAAGVPRDVFQMVVLADRDLGKELITNPLVGHVILTGSIDTAQMFRSWRKDLPLLAETSGKNAIIVTPHADLDLAVKDVVNSAFGHAGQKCSASSLVILVGSVAFSKRFHRQLIDAVKSLVIDYPTNLSAQMGPLTTPADGKLLRGLTTLGPGEHWAIKPEKLDDSGKLWSPGVRAGVQPGSEYHLTEYFGPILGVIGVADLDEAIAVQNATDYGLTAGLHSLDGDEINYWLDRVQAGNVYINRGITGAIVQRQPFGGWKLSAVGNGTKAGGPSYLYAMGTWTRPRTDDAEVHVAAPAPRSEVLLDAIAAAEALGAKEKAFEAAAAALDQEAIDKEFGIGHDPSGLSVERNVLRYLPLPVLVRLAEGGDYAELLRVVALGVALGSEVSVSVPGNVPDAIVDFFAKYEVPFWRASDAEFLEELPNWAEEAGLDGRLRLIGGDAKAVAEALDGSCDVAIWAGEVTYAGRVEGLPFLHEQAVAFTNHRFGNPTPLSDEVHI